MNRAIKSQKSRGQKFIDTVMFALIVAFIVGQIERFFRFLFRPFKSVNGTVEFIEEHQELRNKYLQEIEEDVNDPMYQFQERFVINPEKHVRDPDNKNYKMWYDKFKRGEILDSELRWVPRMYDRDDNILKSFIDYMKIQMKLHKNASHFDKARFFKTIRTYYPELTATFRGLENDLSRYEAIMEKERLQELLAKEIEKYGLSKDLSEYLSTKEYGVEKLREQAKLLKPLSDKGYSRDVCICAVENNLIPAQAKVLELAVEKTGLPVRVPLALIREQITFEDMEDICDWMSTCLDVGGIDIFERWDEIVDEQLVYHKSKKRTKKYV